MKRLKLVNQKDVEVTYWLFCAISIVLAVLIFCLGISRCIQAGEALKEIEKAEMEKLWELEHTPVSNDVRKEYEAIIHETFKEQEDAAQTQIVIGITICFSAIFAAFVSLKWLQVLFGFFYDQKRCFLQQGQKDGRSL